MKNLRKNLMSLLSSQERSERCGRKQMDPSGRTHVRRCSRRRKVNTKAPEYAMSARNLDT